MPWKESSVEQERMTFVVRHAEGERMTDLCQEYGISRKTGYKIWERYGQCGLDGLKDRSRAPKRVSNRTPEATEQLIVAARKKYPTWGGRKLRKWLSQRHPGISLPAPSTFGEILKRHALVRSRPRPRRRPVLSGRRLSVPKGPNDLWAMDFKGQFRLGNGQYCYPLTVTDQFSRFIIGCEGLDGTKAEPTKFVFDAIFERYGLPSVLRSDNGVPFASPRGLLRLSKLSVWFLGLEIALEYIEPGHPEQNGVHERMHLTLKQETTRPAAANMLAQQERFDSFIETFNHQRPHEALELRTPAALYCPSSARYHPSLGPLDYPLHDDVRKISASGHMSLWKRRQHVFVSEALADQRVGLREVADDWWLVSFMQLDLGHIDRRQARFHAADRNLPNHAPPELSQPQ